MREEVLGVRATEKTVLSSNVLDPVVKTLLVGLLTKGEQHKQYYLEKALRMLVVDDYADRAKARFQWESGLAPRKLQDITVVK